jgi:hypothetical protein
MIAWRPVKKLAVIGCRFCSESRTFPGFVTASEPADLFVAGACQQGYNHAVRAFPGTGCGFLLTPPQKGTALTWVDSAEVAYDAD